MIEENVIYNSNTGDLGSATDLYGSAMNSLQIYYMSMPIRSKSGELRTGFAIN